MPNCEHDAPTSTARVQIRVTHRQAELIRAVASQRGVKLTDYIVDSHCAQAEMDLADQSNFSLSPEKWDEFIAALDEPATVPDGLASLFSRPPRARLA